MIAFGEPEPGARERQGSYAVIQDGVNRLLVVRGRRGLFLPGGGVDPGETPLQALHRELHEECGLEGLAPRFLGEALQHYRVEGQAIRMVARFWRVEAGRRLGPGEDEWCWLALRDLSGGFFHASHAWAVGCWGGTEGERS